ncbi:hypothetical protein RB595_010758 [Gaeumannomyces hyphopodioides]
MLAVSSESGHECSTCGKIYQRSSHLRRHEMTHGGDTGFHCPFCHKVFARRDVCRKHSLQCPSKGTRADPPLAKRGQKPRACDGCFRSRLACDNAHPCSRCQTRGVGCSYERLSRNSTTPPHQLPSPDTAVGSSAASPEDEEMQGTATATVTATTTASARESDKDGEEKMAAASFLLSLTNPKAESMVRALINEPRGSRDEELPMPMATTSEICGGGGGGGMTETEADSLDLFLPPSGQQPGILGDLAANGGLFANSGFFPWSLGPQSMDLDDFCVTEPDDAAAQEAAIAAVVDALQETHDWFARSGQGYDDGGAPFGGRGRAAAAQALARPNVRAFVSSYFRNTHHDFPLLHRASFSAEAAAPELLLAVVLCGSLYSPPTDGALSCRGLFHLAEELAFRRLAAALAAAEEAADSASSSDYGNGMQTTTRLHETLQAALIMHGLQNTMSSAPARRRNRTVRLPALVSVVRTLGLSRTRHGHWEEGEEAADESGAEARWAEFVHTETRIRIATWTLLADGQQSGMFHCPQSMTTLEMTGDLPCLAELWDAPGPAEFWRAVNAHGGPASCLRRGCSIRVAVESLMADDDDDGDNDGAGPERFPLRHLTLPDLQVLVFAIHGTIRSARFANLLPASAPVIVRAVSRWEALWDRAARGFTPEELSRRGLVRHSGELCWLAKKMLAVLVSGAAEDSGYFQGVAHDSLEELHAFLRRHCLGL